MSAINLLITASMAMGATSQTLVYDLSVNGLIVGHRKVVISYLQVSADIPFGGRRIECWTEIDTKIAGKSFSYRQRASSLYIDQYPKKFVSSVSINKVSHEIQGRQNGDGSWLITTVRPDGIQEEKHRRGALQGSSLDLFDPGQLELWNENENVKLYSVEHGDSALLSGTWSSLGPGKLSDDHSSLHGKRLELKTEPGTVSALWTHDGLLLDWQLKISGITIDSNIRALPEAPDFGEIAPIEGFDGVEEQEL